MSSEKYIFITVLFVFCIVFKSVNASENEGFGAWRVNIEYDGFEEKIKPALTTDIASIDGGRIGELSLGYFMADGGKFYNAILDINIEGMDGTWPACDYEFAKYKVDNSRSKFFETRGHACPSLMFYSNMVPSFKNGKTLKLSVNNVIGDVDLSGFSKAWAYTIGRMRAGK